MCIKNNVVEVSCILVIAHHVSLAIQAYALCIARYLLPLISFRLEEIRSHITQRRKRVLSGQYPERRM